MKFDSKLTGTPSVAQQLLDRQKVAVPAPVLEHGEPQIALARELDRVLRFLARQAERLVDDVFPGQQRASRQRAVRGVGRGDDDEFDVCVGEDLVAAAVQCPGVGAGKFCKTAATDRLEREVAVNGERRQTGNTSKMIFPCDYIVSSCSQVMTLEPGDLIITGTPPGVGLGCKPPQFLKPDDVVELSISGQGQQRQRVVCA